MAGIEKKPFGKTGQLSSRIIFGSVCLYQAEQDAADEVLESLFEYGCIHHHHRRSAGTA